MPMTTVYHPPPVTHYQSSCRWSCFPLLSGPVWLRVYFFFEIFVAVLATFSQQQKMVPHSLWLQLYKALRLRMAAAFVQIWNFLLNHFISTDEINNYLLYFSSGACNQMGPLIDQKLDDIDRYCVLKWHVLPTEKTIESFKLKKREEFKDAAIKLVTLTNSSVS